jgi:hypothetical protein
MVVIDTRRGPLKYRLAFWPDASQLAELAESAGPNTLIKVVQSTAELEGHPRMIRSGIFRTQVIDLGGAPDDVFAGMNKTTRNEIRGVGREGDQIRITRNEPTAMIDFFDMYNSFVRLSGHIRPLNRRRFREYAAVSDVWVAYRDEKAACGRLTLRDETLGRACMIFSPSRRLEEDGDAKITGRLSRYLLWSELEAYRAEGFHAYDLGGIGDGTSSVARFKLGFGGERVQENSYLLGGPVGRAADRFEKFRTRSWQRSHA